MDGCLVSEVIGPSHVSNRRIAMTSSLLLELFTMLQLLLPSLATPEGVASVTGTLNFKNSPSCYHDNVRACRYSGRPVACGPTRSMSRASIKCYINSTKKLDDIQNIPGEGNVSLSHKFVYPSRSAHCYPYLNLTWTVNPELLQGTSRFYVSISYEHLGVLRVVSRLVDIFVEKTPDFPVRFFFDCHQVAYPGVVYRAFVSALNENHVTLDSSHEEISAPCRIEFSKNPARIYPDVKEEWIPNYRVEVSEDRAKVFFTMPDCDLGIWAVKVVLHHLGSGKEFLSRRIECPVCPFTNFETVTNLPGGTYQLTFYTFSSTATVGKEILRVKVEVNEGQRSPEIDGAKSTIDVRRAEWNATGAERRATTMSGVVRGAWEVKVKDSDQPWGSTTWIVTGVILVGLWLLTLALYCCRIRSAAGRREITVCLRGTLGFIIKSTRLSRGDDKEQTALPHHSWSDRVDSGFSTAHSHSIRASSGTWKTAGNADSSLGYASASFDRCCSCRESCPECSGFGFDLQVKFHPPSDDVCSMSSFEFREKIKSFNLESDGF